MIERPRVKELPGLKAKEVIEKNYKYIAISTQDPDIYPIVIERGKGVIIEDIDGNTFYDFGSGFAVMSLGHSHPKIVEAIKRQAEKFTHFPLNDFYFKIAVDLAEKLVSTAPGDFEKRVLFQNSGAEANELMMKLVKYSTKRKRFIAFYHSFHGRTHAALSFTASKWIQQESYFPTVPGVVHIPYPNPFRNTWHIDGYEEPDELVNRVIEYIEEYVFRHVPPHEIGSIVFEPIQGEGGYIVPPKSFFKELKKLAEKYGILLADDEVQMGMGRTGRFWAIEHFGIEPDFIQFGKAVGGGLPLSGVIHRHDKSFDKTGLHSSTFGGNVVAIAAANIVVEEVKRLLPHVREVGDYLGKQLKELKEDYDIVGDARGIGLAQAIEIVKDKKTREPWPKMRDTILRNSVKKGLIMIGCGDSAIRIIPPLIVEEEHIDVGMSILREAIKDSIKQF